MNKTEFRNLLKKLHACNEARQWADGLDLKTAWSTCERPDWLLWLTGTMADKERWPTREQVILSACDCAEAALKYVPKNENRPRKAIEAARFWANNPTDENKLEAARAAEASARAAWEAAREEAGAAAWAAAWAAEGAAARAAWAAAGAAARAAAGAAEAAGDSDFKKQLCELIRSRLIFDAIK